MGDYQEQGLSSDSIRRLLNDVNAAVFVVNSVGNVIEWNSKAAQIVKRSSAEMLGKPLAETLEVEGETLGDLIAAGLQGASSESVELHLLSKDGLCINLLVNISPRQSADGQVTGVIGVFQEITERSSDESSQIINSVPALIFCADRKGYLTEWNSMAESCTGCAKSQILGRPFIDVYASGSSSSTEREIAAKSLEDVLAGKQDLASIELPLVARSSKSCTRVLFNVRPRVDADGEIIGVVGVGYDMTEMTTKTQESQKKAADLIDVFDSFPVPVVVLDTWGRVYMWNHIMTELSGTSAEAAVGRYFVQDLLPDKDRPKAACAILSALGGEKDVMHFEISLQGNDGRGHVVPMYAAARRGSDGTVIGTVVVGSCMPGQTSGPATPRRQQTA